MYNIKKIQQRDEKTSILPKNPEKYLKCTLKLGSKALKLNITFLHSLLFRRLHHFVENNASNNSTDLTLNKSDKPD